MIALIGGAAALIAVSLVVYERRGLIARAERVARATGELRGPLAAAQVALVSLTGGGGHRVSGRSETAAADAQLRHAVLSLGAPSSEVTASPGEMRRELVDVAALLDAQLRAWAPVAQRRGMRLRVAGRRPRAWVRADGARLGVALGNVVANALEHGGDPVDLTVRATGGTVRIEVRDGGPGLARPLPVLAAPARHDGSGRGLGLAVATEIVRRHGGWLGAAPAESGACIALELPAALSAVAPLTPPTR